MTPRAAVVAALVVMAPALVGCGERAPTCAAVERRLRWLAARRPPPAPRQGPAGRFADGAFSPADWRSLDVGAVDELVAQCRAGMLAPTTVRCLTTADRPFAVDRCVARDPSWR